MITKGHSFSFLLSAPSVSLPLVPLATQELPGWGGRLFPQPPLSFSISEQSNFVTNSIQMIMAIWIWYNLDSKEQCKFWAWIWQNSIVWFDDGAWIPVYKSVIFSLPYLSKSAQFCCQRQTQVGLVYQWGHFWQELRNDSWRLTSANDWSYERFYLEVGGVSISVSPISSLVMELVVSRRQSSCFKTLW